MDETASVAVVEDIRTDAATEAAQTVATEAALATVVVAAEVDRVSSQVSEHAVVSEERHDEILEGEAWTRNRLEVLSTQMIAVQATMQALMETVRAENQLLRAELVQMRENGSTVSPLSNQPTLQEVPVQVEVVEPAAAVEDHLEAATPENKPKRRRLI